MNLPQHIWLEPERESCSDPDCKVPRHKALWDKFRGEEGGDGGCGRTHSSLGCCGGSGCPQCCDPEEFE